MRVPAFDGMMGGGMASCFVELNDDSARAPE